MLIMECRYYQKLDDGRVECTLCPHHCRIAEGKTGVCRSRRNQALPTPIATQKAAKRVAEEEGIKHVYLGNVY